MEGLAPVNCELHMGWVIICDQIVWLCFQIATSSAVQLVQILLTTTQANAVYA